MNPEDTITVSVTLPCSPRQAWMAFTDPSSVMAWHFASPEWHCPAARNEVRPGGTFSYRMEAVDGSMGFDYEGTFLEVCPHAELRLALGPEREVLVRFAATEHGTEVSQTFTPDATVAVDAQRLGWQAIMDNYARHASSSAPGEA